MSDNNNNNNKVKKTGKIVNDNMYTSKEEIRVMDQETIYKILNKPLKDNIINDGKYNVIKDIKWAGGHDLYNENIPNLLIQNVNFNGINMEDIYIKQGIDRLSIDKCDLNTVEVIRNDELVTVVIRDSDIGALNFNKCRIRRVLLYNCKVNNLLLTDTIIPRGILLNYNTKIDRLYMHNSLINNTDKHNFNEANDEFIKEADDLIMDDKLISVIKSRIDIIGSHIIEETKDNRFYIDVENINREE